MLLKDSQHFTSRAAGNKPAQTAVIGLCIAALAGAAAGFCLAVKLGKHKREIGSGCRPAVPDSDGAADDAPSEAGKARRFALAKPGKCGNSVRKNNSNEHKEQ